MTITRNLIGSGFSGSATQAIVGNPTVGLTATGNSLATALAAPSDFLVFSTTAASTGVRLPAFTAATGPAYGDVFTVVNDGASTLSVYPGTAAGKIQNGSAGAAFSVATNKVAHFFYKGTDQWAAILSA